MELNFLQKLVISFLIFIYLVFLIADYKNLFNTDILKFISIIICFLLSFSYKETISIRDITLLRIARTLTIITDYFLLLTEKYFLGISLFCIVQIIYIHRHGVNKRGDFLNNIMKLMIILIASISVFYLFDILRDKALYIVIAIYGGLVLASTKVAFSSKNYGNELKINKKLIWYGMLLFLICDINVGLTSYLSSLDLSSGLNNSIKNLSGYLIWLFYLPSQIFLSLSGKKY